MKAVVIAALSSLLFVLIQCGQTKQENSSQKENRKINVTNPNGMSEMSLLMEEITQDLMEVRSSLLDSSSDIKKLPVAKSYSRAYVSKTSKKHTVDEKFRRYYVSFLAAVELFNSAQRSEKITEFNRMITTCKNCHQDICPGPLTRINKLFIREN